MKKFKHSKNPITDSGLQHHCITATQHYNRSYTLVEILMVIVIMALLMAVAMPAFTEMMKGQGVEASARNLGQILKLARSHAINNREYVAVLMPQSAKNGAAYPTTTGNHLPSKYYDSSYRVCLVKKDGSGGYDFKRWLSGENWNFLSTGVAIFETNSNPDVTFNAGQPTNDTSCTRVNKVKLGDINSNLDDTNTSDDTDDVAAIIFKPTGKCAASTNMYIKIGEGTYSGSALVVTNQDPNAAVTITINQYTGRVTYGTE